MRSVPRVRYKVAEPETRYDPVLLEKELFKQPVRWLVRNVELFLPLGTFAAKVLLDVQVGGRYKPLLSRYSKAERIISQIHACFAFIIILKYFPAGKFDLWVWNEL